MFGDSYKNSEGKMLFLIGKKKYASKIVCLMIFILSDCRPLQGTVGHNFHIVCTFSSFFISAAGTPVRSHFES